MSNTAFEDITMNLPKEGEDFVFSDQNLLKTGFSDNTQKPIKPAAYTKLLSDQNLFMVVPASDIQQDIEDKENKEIFNESLAQIDRAIQFERKYLENEGIDLPNENVKNSTVFLLYKLASEGIHPVKITTTVEEGLYLVFNNYPYILYLEIYNNGDIGYIIEDVRYNKLVEMKDMYSILEVKNRISQFYW